MELKEPGAGFVYSWPSEAFAFRSTIVDDINPA